MKSGEYVSVFVYKFQIAAKCSVVLMCSATRVSLDRCVKVCVFNCENGENENFVETIFESESVIM